MKATSKTSKTSKTAKSSNFQVMENFRNRLQLCMANRDQNLEDVIFTTKIKKTNCSPLFKLQWDNITCYVGMMDLWSNGIENFRPATPALKTKPPGRKPRSAQCCEWWKTWEILTKSVWRIMDIFWKMAYQKG